MNKYFYPAIFHTAEEGGFWISFPDFPECFSEGDDMTHAYEMAIDALGLAISSKEADGENLPIPTDVRQISPQEGDCIVLMEFDQLAYYRKHNAKSIKKTLTIPEWLNEAAIAAGINFSQVLQEALVLKLHVK